jgi:Asp-tRNA(Asn)/Glu-tRNA(Gln) amidotransferase C subunit
MCWQSLLEYKQIMETTDKDWTTSMIAHNRTLRADTTKDQNRAKSLKAGGSGFEQLL